LNKIQLKKIRFFLLGRTRSNTFRFRQDLVRPWTVEMLYTVHVSCASECYSVHFCKVNFPWSSLELLLIHLRFQRKINWGSQIVNNISYFTEHVFSVIYFKNRNNHRNKHPRRYSHVLYQQNRLEVSICGLRFEPCGCSYDSDWRLTWSLTSGPVGLVEVRASWPGHPH